MTADLGEQFMDNELDALERGKRQSDFPPLIGGDNRPVTWFYQLDTIRGRTVPTNSVTIYSRPVLAMDESGENGYEKFAVVTLTRAEIAKILRVLDEDIAEMRRYCPDREFE